MATQSTSATMCITSPGSSFFFETSKHKVLLSLSLLVILYVVHSLYMFIFSLNLCLYFNCTSATMCITSPGNGFTFETQGIIIIISCYIFACFFVICIFYYFIWTYCCLFNCTGATMQVLISLFISSDLLIYCRCSYCLMFFASRRLAPSIIIKP